MFINPGRTGVILLTAEGKSVSMLSLRQKSGKKGAGSLRNGRGQP
jgi:hypothetical protein